MALFVAGAAGVALERLFARDAIARPHARLKLHAWLFIGTIAAPFLRLETPENFRFEAPLKVWAAAGPHAEAWHADRVPTLGAPLVAEGSWPVAWPALLLGSLLAISFTLWARKIRSLRRLARDAYRLRRVGRVEILVSDRVDGPLSFRLPGRAIVVLPDWILERAEQRRIAVLHELQHHRAGDTLVAHGLALLRAFYFWNPFLPSWERGIQELQEYACDGALIGRRKVSPRAYGRCLLAVAQRPFERPRSLVGTPGFAWRLSKGHLKRRIEIMISVKDLKPGIGRRTLLGFFAFAIGGFGVAAWASQNVIKDARLSLADARKLAEGGTREGGVPLFVNEAVLEQLNRYVATPAGRDFVRESIARLETMRPTLEGKARQHSAPVELLAIPLVESGYQNLPAARNPQGSAGVWQFIRSTARRYGMKVEGKVDERLDLEKATDAALRYVLGSNLTFQDWWLAILSYNAGAQNVQRRIEAAGTRDAFALVASKGLGDPNYLPKVMAAMLILRHPQLVR